MTTRFEQIRASVRAADAGLPVPPADTPDNGDMLDDEDEMDADGNPKPGKSGMKKDKNMAEQNSIDTDSPTYAAGRTAGMTAAAARFQAVVASEHTAGREATALRFLATSMSAEEITGLLAAEPKAEATPAAAADDAVGQRMLDAMASNAPDLGADAGAPKPAANHGWDDVHAEIRANRVR